MSERDSLSDTSPWWHLGQCLIWISERRLEPVNRAGKTSGHQLGSVASVALRKILASVALRKSGRTSDVSDQYGDFAFRVDYAEQIRELRSAGAAGRIKAFGRGPVEIPASDWPRVDIAFPSHTALPELIYLAHPNTGGKSMFPLMFDVAYRDVLIRSANMIAVFKPADLVRTGLPGRPSSRELVQRELERRIASGHLGGCSITEVATDLAKWHATHYPSGPRLTSKTIYNTLGSKIREALSRK